MAGFGGSLRWKCKMMSFALLVLAGGLALFIQMYFSSSSLENSRKLEILETNKHTTKVILMHPFPPWYELQSGGGHFASCNRSCILTLDSRLMPEADTIVIYSHPFQTADSDVGLYISTPKQTWVYFAVESPINSLNYQAAKPNWQFFFNWTMTYRRDSDMYFGYGDFVRKPFSTSPEKDISAVVSGKSKMVAWFVSNCICTSKRGDIAAALKDFVTVDIYGKCGDLKCGAGDDQCFSMLSKDYFFYLAFENSLCKDYVTEKLYLTMKKVDIIPVVYGGANYSALLPKQSYIDVGQFATIKELADYLKKVASDRKLYESYFEWRKDLKVLEPSPFPFCDLCWRSHHPENFHKVYESVDSWWEQDACWVPKPFVKS